MEKEHQNNEKESVDVNNNLGQNNKPVSNSTVDSKSLPLPHKNKKFKLISFIVLCFVVLTTFIVTIVVIRNQVTQFEITIDPIIVSNSQENHVNGAQKLSITGNNMNSNYNTSIETTLRNEEYMYYNYTMKNLSKSTIKTTLTSEIYSSENVYLSYSINNEPQQELTDLIDETIFHAGESKNIKIYINVINTNLDSHVKGKLILFCSEEKVG